MKNWQTSAGAFVVLLTPFLTKIGIDITPEIKEAILTVGIVLIGFFAKDGRR